MSSGGPSLGDNADLPDRLSADSFKTLIERFALGPAPRLAVAVSGGADSLALTLLADEWARAEKGAIVALTVDHGLRPEAADEARQVAAWLGARGVEHHVLRWQPPDGERANLQARAREARYGLLTSWCRAHHVRHLLVAHHRDDQAETFMLRLARGSGVDGLAAMSALSMRDGVTLLRPLLDVPKAALVACLREREQSWIEDPSNRDASYARVRMRALMPLLAAEGLTIERLAATAARLDDARDALDRACRDLLASAAELHDTGYAVVEPQAFADAPRDLAHRALARLLMALGGQTYTPRFDGLERLAADLCDVRRRPDALGGGRTLAGCCIVPQGDGRVMILREARGLADPVALGLAETHWDGRFTVTAARPFPNGTTLGALGDAGWQTLRPEISQAELLALPRALLPTLPALRDGGGLAAVPHLAWRRAGWHCDVLSHSGQSLDRADDYVIAGPAGKLQNRQGFTLV